MKRLCRGFEFVLAVALLFGGCAANQPSTPVLSGSSSGSVVSDDTSSEEESSQANSEESSAGSSSVQSSPQPSSAAQPSSSPASASSQSSSASSGSAENKKQMVSQLSVVLSELQRTGASDAARQKAESFLTSATELLPKSQTAMTALLGLCSKPEQTDGLSALITAATQESKISRETFQLAAAACRERGRKTADSVTLTFTGDCTFSPINEESHQGSFDQVYAKQKSDSYPFDRMFPWFATDDITCINFEGTLTKSLAHAEKTYYFRGDPSLAKILPSSSVELANLANNHTMDYFQRGYDDTKSALTAAGAALITVQQPYVTTVNGIQVVFIGQQLTSGAKAAAKLVKQYKRADNIVIVVMHWSTEFSNQVAPGCVTAGRELIDAGADLVIGHHPHVLQGIELYKNKYIVYSLGNFAFGANVGPVTSPYAMAFRARFSRNNGGTAMTSAEIVPCNPTSDASGWNNYQPKPLFGQKARELADYVISISSSLKYGVKQLSYFDV